VAEADGQDRIQLALVAAAELGLALRHPDDRRFRWDRMLADAQADPFSAQVDPLRSAQLIDLITRAAALAAKADGR
jgi:hypothetical protein